MIKLTQIIEELKPPAPEKIYRVEPEDDKLAGEREEKGPKRTRTSKKAPGTTDNED
jgi:hypothetical protein